MNDQNDSEKLVDFDDIFPIYDKVRGERKRVKDYRGSLMQAVYDGDITEKGLPFNESYLEHLSIHIKGNAYFNEDLCLYESELFVDGDLWVNGSIGLIGPDPVYHSTIKVKGNIYCTGSIKFHYYSDYCRISAKSIKINNCLIIDAASAFVKVKEDLYVGGICLFKVAPSVGGKLYGTVYRI